MGRNYQKYATNAANLERESLTSSLTGFEAFQYMSSAEEIPRIIYLNGNISEANVAMATTNLTTLSSISRKPIYMVISTFGGSMYDAIGLIDMMDAVPCEIRTIGTGKIMSAGVNIFCQGQKGKRLIGRNTTFMIHNGMTSLEHVNIFELENEKAELERMEEIYITHMLKKTKMTKEKVMEMLKSRNDVYIPAHEAIELGLADGYIGENSEVHS